MLEVLIGFLGGIVSGMGIGGGSILIPLLVLFGITTQKTAQSINLFYFIPTAIAALCIHCKEKNLCYDGIWTFIGVGIVGTVFGAFVAKGLPMEMLKNAFALFLCVMGMMELWKKS